MEQHRPWASAGLRRIDRAARWAGTLLGWTHATALVATAAEAFLHPWATWWPYAWIAPWVLTGVLLIGWVLLRIGQKRRLRQVAQADDCDGRYGCDDCDGPEDPDAPSPEGTVGYGQAA